MRTIFKNILHVFKRFKTSGLFIILGLSLALIVFFLVLMQAYYDLTFDKSYNNYKEIFQFNEYDENEGSTSTHINFQIPALMKSSIPEIKDYCMMSNWGEQVFDIYKDGSQPEVHSIPYIRTTSGFYNVFSPEILMGDTSEIFLTHGKAMISDKMAKILFGDEDPVGKSLKYHYGNEEIIIQAVYRHFPDNSSLPDGIYTFLPEYNDSEWSFNSYFLIDPVNLENVNEKMNSAEVLGEETIKYLEEHPEVRIKYQMTSLNKLHLNTGGKGGSKLINTIISLLVIGILTLVISFTNFINLSLAIAPTRVKGINIRKILGINKKFLRFSIAMESVLFTVISIIIAFVVIYFLRNTTLAQEFFTSDLKLGSHIVLLVVASVIILVISFLLGFYTMRYSTSFDEAEALKGSFVFGVKGAKLRNVLIVLQFTTAIALICISTIIKQQNDYMMDYDWGIPKENIIYFPLAGLGESAQSFGQELLRDPHVVDYSVIRDLPGRVGMSWGRDFEGKHINMYVWSVDDRFFDFFDIELIAGREPESMDTAISFIIVNEAFVNQYEFDENIIGKDFDAFGAGRIQAIAKNINFHSLHDPITPMAFGILARWQNFNYFLVKLTGNDMPGAINYIEQTWNKFSKEPFELRFLDESMDRLYQSENNMAKLIGIFGFIIVFIAIMGVYGLIVFNTKYKRKEIAVRKVNGSSVKEIIFMLNRAVLIQLAISFVIAVPIAYFVSSFWLGNFAYRIDIKWWVFLLSGLIVLVITLLTVSGQSYRAATTNPTKYLKNE